MNTGIVQFFDETKGFGFIKDASSLRDIFVHVTELIDEIKEEDEVCYEIRESRKGLNAFNVKVL